MMEMAGVCRAWRFSQRFLATGDQAEVVDAVVPGLIGEFVIGDSPDLAYPSRLPPAPAPRAIDSAIGRAGDQPLPG